jgi:hypothetical protein
MHIDDEIWLYRRRSNKIRVIKAKVVGKRPRHDHIFAVTTGSLFDTYSVMDKEGMPYRSNLWLNTRNDRRARLTFEAELVENAKYYAKKAANNIKCADELEVVDDKDYTKVH